MKKEFVKYRKLKEFTTINKANDTNFKEIILNYQCPKQWKHKLSIMDVLIIVFEILGIIGDFDDF